MMRSVRNEKGLTLIELLAAIAISSLLLGVAAVLLSSVIHLSGTSSQTYADQSAMKYTMTTLAAQLSDSTQAVYYASNNELRYKNGKEYKSAVFDGANGTLTVYRFSDDGDSTNDDAHFANGGISIKTNRALYTSPVTLNKAIASITYKQANGAMVPSVPLKNGEWIKIEAVFQFHNVSLGGARSVVSRAESTGIKLMVDTTSK